MRIDFPHEGAEYLHLNLHEPHRQTAIPLNYKQYSMLIQEGHEHDGLVDAENTAKLFAKMVLEPELKLNSYFESAHNECNDTLCFSMGDLFKNLQLA